MQIIPKGLEPSDKTGPLEVDDKKFTEMVAKAKELLKVPMEPGELREVLEQHYVASNEHYTSVQLKKVVVQVAADLNPPEPEEVVEEPIAKVVKEPVTR